MLMMDRPFHKADLRLLILGKEYEIHMIYEPACTKSVYQICIFVIYRAELEIPIWNLSFQIIKFNGSRRWGPDLDFH